MKTVIVALAFLSVVLAESTFDEWKKKTNATYAGKAEAAAAEKTYKASAAAVDKHNADPKNTYKTSANEAADKSPEQLAQRRGLKASKNVKSGKLPQQVRGTPPANLSYVSQMPAIDDQGNCGSCWAVSTASVYDYLNLKQSKTVPMSRQNFVDCDKNSGGCSGGHPASAMYYSYTDGISSGTEYKYVAKTQKCLRTATKYKSIYKSTGPCAATLNGNEVGLVGLLAQYGPVVTAISVGTCSPLSSGTSFDFYKTGIFNDEKCSKLATKVDHAVVIVGYGADAGDKNPYWIIRNSYGTTWGEKGFMRVARGKNIMGLANQVYIPCEAAGM